MKWNTYLKGEGRFSIYSKLTLIQGMVIAGQHEEGYQILDKASVILLKNIP